MVMEANQKVQEINITLNEYMPEFKSECKSKYKSWSSSEIITDSERFNYYCVLVFQLEKRTTWKLMKTWLLLTTVPQVRKKGRGLIRFFYDYNEMILQLEPRYLNDHEQTE